MTTQHRPSYRAATLLGAMILTVAMAAPAAAQDHDHHGHHGHHTMAMPSEGLRAELIADVDAVADKYLALADAMTEHYAWRPAEGVRSMGELLMHMAAANFMIPTMAGVELPEGMTMAEVREMERITDPAQIREALAHSFRHLRHAIAMTPDDALDDPTTMFGRETTKRGVLLLLATHAHEHLGQAIAYTRTNGVTPPWSAARN
jgi:uncharacterized damage-inducible protein DinB